MAETAGAAALVEQPLLRVPGGQQRPVVRRSGAGAFDRPLGGAGRDSAPRRPDPALRVDLGREVRDMADFLLGANTVVFAAIALFFLRFWRQTRDPLFRLFAA